MPDIITSDLHLSDNPRDDYRFQFFEQRLPRIMRQHDKPRLFLLGDMTEAKDHHSSRLVNRIVDGLIQLAEIGPVIWLRGNHDCDVPESPFFAFIKHMDNLHFINEVTLTDTWDLLLPHSRNPAEDWKGLPLKEARMILAHNTFAGAVDKVPLAGVPPPSKSIPIISGDVHVPQKLGNVTYVGSPYAIDFGDSFQPRLLIRRGITLTTLKLKGPQKRVLMFGEYPAGAFRAGDIVRIKVQLKRQDYDRWAEIRDKARKTAEEQGMIVESVVPIVEPGAIGKVEQRGRGPQSDQQTLADYCARYQIDRPTAQQGEELL